MDQIYVPKNRPPGLESGTYVLIAPALENEKTELFYYNIKKIEPIKVQIIEKIFEFINAENVIVCGSFLEKGFGFEDIDVIVVKGQGKGLKDFIWENFGLETHLIEIDYPSLRNGLNTDPLFQMLLSKFVAKERVLFKMERKINYKHMDLHLIHSNALIYAFDVLGGNEKYKLLRNSFGIKMFIENKKMDKYTLNKEIDNYFGKGFIEEVLKNTLEKKEFIKKYKKFHKNLFNKIMDGVCDASK